MWESFRKLVGVNSRSPTLRRKEGEEHPASRIYGYRGFLHYKKKMKNGLTELGVANRCKTFQQTHGKGGDSLIHGMKQ